MSSEQDIAMKTRSVTEGADCRTESEYRPAHGRAYEDAAVDMIHHHNEWGREKERGPAPKTEPEPDYEREGTSPTIEPRCIRQ